MAKYWIHEGTPVKCTSTGKKLEKFLADNDHLGDTCTKKQYDAAIAENEAKANKHIRRAAYTNMMTCIAEVLIANEDKLTIPTELAADWAALKEL